MDLNVDYRINMILYNEVFTEYIFQLKKLEEDRIFCKHGIDHCLDVARIMYIINLENKLDFKKDIIYATALLHDLGRVDEYNKSIEHHKASAKIAEIILTQCNFSNEEIKVIYNAILNHRVNQSSDKGLNSLLYFGDKQSRNCFNCISQNLCKWNKDKMNLKIKY